MRVSVKILLFLLLSFFAVNAQEVKVDMNPKQILIGEQVILSIKVSLPITDSIAWPDIASSLPKELEVLDVQAIDSSFNKEDIRIRELSQKLTITAFDTGYYPIPSLQFVGSNTNLSSEGMVLLVSPMQLDSTSQLADIYDPIAVPYTFSEFLQDYGWYILIAILIGLVSVYILKNRKKWMTNQDEKPIVIKELIPAHITALKRLNNIYKGKTWNQSVKNYYSEVSEILRTYLEERYHILAMEQTTAEIINSIYSRISKEQKDNLQRILQDTDMVKFAKFQPDASQHEPLVKLCIDWVTETQEKIEDDGRH